MRAVNGAAFFERDHSPDHSVLILGSGQSGTTGLAEVLARQSQSRLIFEPFHPIWTPKPDDLRLFLSAEARDPGMEELTVSLLEGRTRKAPICNTVISRLPRGRVIKDIHAGNLLPWLQSRHPRMPIVYAVRHPIPTALSRRRIGDFYGLARYLETAKGRRDAEASPVARWLPVYDRYREDPDAIVRLVAEWCVENALALRWAETGQVKVSYYERVVIDPVAEAADLARHCLPAIHFGGIEFDGAALRRPSSQAQSGRIAAANVTRDWDQMLSGWTREVEPRTANRCLDVLAEFGLDEYYGAGPLPTALS